MKALDSWMLALAAACTLLASCATPEPAAVVRKDNLLSFIVDGTTTSTDVMLKLGPPSARFENGRVAMWRLNQDQGDYFVIPANCGWSGVRYELVVAFTPQRVVERHSLVEIRAPAPGR